MAQAEWHAADKPGEPYLLSTDPEWRYKDAELTAEGEQQARDLQVRAAKLRPELLVVSPMRRATQTGLIAFEEHITREELPVVAHEGCHEIGGKHTCDKRLDRERLQELYPVVDYSGIQSEEDPFWGDGSTRESSEHLAKRCADFVAWLRDRPEEHIAVAAHSTMLFHLLNVVAVADSQDATWFNTGTSRMLCVRTHLLQQGEMRTLMFKWSPN